MVVMRIISIILIIIGLLITIIKDILVRKNNNAPKKSKKNSHDFCILIPARDESRVIEGLIKSIEKQTYKVNMKDVYVIVESKNDKTVDICKKHGVSVVIRKHLELQRKGYALDEAVKEILSKNKHYDAYFIFDADNILHKDFIKNIVPYYDKGYDFVMGYRDTKNGNDSIISGSSSLIFSVLNTLFNKRAVRETRNVIFSGTGLYIKGYIIEKEKGFPWNTLTEDYEVSCYAILNNYTTCYCEDCVFYDEQPITFSQMFTQRTRWIRGYFEVRGKYNKVLLNSVKLSDNNFGSKLSEAIGILPVIIIVLGYFIWLMSSIVNVIITKASPNSIIETAILLFMIYIVLFIVTVILLITEKNKLSISKKMRAKVLFYNPIFLLAYVPCAIKALTKRKVTWDKIKHGN